MLWIRLSLRLVVVLAGIGLIVPVLHSKVDGPVSSELAYRSSRPCSSSADHLSRVDCVASIKAAVADLSYTADDENSGTVYHFYLTARVPSGSVLRLEVDRDIYETASAGDQAALSLWNGFPVGITVDGLSYFDGNRSLPWGWALWLGLVWLGLGMVLWGLCGDAIADREYRRVTLVRLYNWVPFGIATIAAFAVPVADTPDAIAWWAIVLDVGLWLGVAAYFLRTIVEGVPFMEGQGESLVTGP